MAGVPYQSSEADWPGTPAIISYSCLQFYKLWCIIGNARYEETPENSRSSGEIMKNLCAI